MPAQRQAPEWTASELVSAFLRTAEHSIVPLTTIGVASGNKLFGAAILRKEDLSLVIAATNQETNSPLLIRSIPEWRELSVSGLSGITWSGFDNFYYLFSYQDTKDAFAIPHDIKILQEVYKVPAKGESETDFGERELYNRSNAFWASRGVEGLLADVTDQEEKNGLIKQIEGIKASYNKLSETYQASKGNAGIPLD